MSRTAAPNVLVFDVNETLLDIDSLEPLFIRLFGNKHVMREWFAQLVLYFQALTLAKVYATYSQNRRRSVMHDRKDAQCGNCRIRR